MDGAAWLNAVADGVARQAGTLSALHTLVLVLLLGLGARGLLEPLRRAAPLEQLWLGLGLLAAAGLRTFYVPALSRHVFDGHEADYYDVWRGVQSGLGDGYRASEWMRFLYAQLGPWLGGQGQWLVLLTLLLSVLTLPLVWVWARELTGREAVARWALLLLVLDPVHAFWASSAYNIQLPFSMSVLSLTALERGIRRGSPLLLALSTVALGAALAARGEALLIGVVWGLRIVLHFRRTLLPSAARLALLLPLPFLAWPVLAGMQGLGGQTSRDYMLELWRQQWWLLDYLAPYDRGSFLGLLGGMLLLVGWIQVPLRAVFGVLLLGIFSHHLAYALFDDYDFRHTLFPRLGYAVLVGGVLAFQRDAWTSILEKALKNKSLGDHFKSRFELLIRGGSHALLLLPLLWGLGKGMQDMAERYYAHPEDYFAQEPRLQQGPFVNLDDHKGCIFVVEDIYYSRFARASHFELYTQKEYEKLLSRSGGCILFVLDLENYQASSRSIDGRALKLRRWYQLTPLGRRIDRQAEHYSLIFRVEGRKE